MPLQAFLAARGQLDADRGLCSQLVILRSHLPGACPASEHVSWHKLCQFSGYRDFALSSRGWSDAARTHFKRAALCLLRSSTARSTPEESSAPSFWSLHQSVGKYPARQVVLYQLNSECPNWGRLACATGDYRGAIAISMAPDARDRLFACGGSPADSDTPDHEAARARHETKPANWL